MRSWPAFTPQILDLRRRAQDTINELERVPRGELVIAARFADGVEVPIRLTEDEDAA